MSRNVLNVKERIECQGTYQSLRMNEDKAAAMLEDVMVVIPGGGGEYKKRARNVGGRHSGHTRRRRKSTRSIIVITLENRCHQGAHDVKNNQLEQVNNLST